MTFLTVQEVCNADFRTVYGCEAAKRYTVFFIAECYEEIFGEEKSNVQETVNAAQRGCCDCNHRIDADCVSRVICRVRGGDIVAKIPKMTLSRFIKEQRKNQNITYKDLADASGVSLSSIRGYCNGTADIMLSKLAKLVKATGHRLCICKEKDRTGGNQHGQTH